MTTWRRHPQALSRNSADQVVVLPAGQDQPVVLSSSGAAIWETLAEPCTTDEVAGRLAEAFEGDPERIRRDVASFLDELAAQGMVTSEP